MTIKLPETKDKEGILKAAREKRLGRYRLSPASNQPISQWGPYRPEQSSTG